MVVGLTTSGTPTKSEYRHSIRVFMPYTPSNGAPRSLGASVSVSNDEEDDWIWGMSGVIGTSLESPAQERRDLISLRDRTTV